MICKLFNILFSNEEPVKKERKTDETLRMFTTHVNVSRVTTGNGLEKAFRRLRKNPWTLVQRADYKNNVPDFLVSNEYGEFAYVECKYYGALKDKLWVDVVRAYVKKQPKQWEAFKKLSDYAPVYFFTVARKDINSDKAQARLIKIDNRGVLTLIV